MSNTITTQKNTSKKFKAILAGGVVLGVGAAVTLAAWTDQQWATADFSSGSFTLESSTSEIFDEKSFDSHDNPGTLKFEMPQASQLGPNEQVAAPFSIRLNDETTHNASVTMVAGKVTDPAVGLSYEVLPVDSPELCATDLSKVDKSKTTLGEVPTNFRDITLTAGEGSEPGDPSTLCFIVSTDENLPEKQSTSATWAFDAVLAED